MTDGGSVADPVGQLAEEFVARYRRGERPALSEYTEKYPELAERIRDVFPMLVVMEEADSGSGSSADVTGVGPAKVPGREGGPPAQVAGYRILREVGRGGMGVVYEAEQLALGRHVALKVLPEPIARDPRGLERFRREARAAARLHHTNIVPVHEVGQDGGVVFYAMQFIQGQPLDAVLDELKALRHQPGAARAAAGTEAPGPAAEVAHSLLTGRFEAGPVDEPDRVPEAPSTVSMPPDSGTAAPSPAVLPGQSSHSTTEARRRHFDRSVAQVGVQVAEALAYAHREGVIHRDIKPSNLLLDTESRVWVTDFGLAKTDGDALTYTGDIVGTLRYMAPERFRGWSDPRSDVYSLGLTLYEMLLLRPAFETADRPELIRRITHEEPVRPRKLDPRIPRDLETIVLKAIDREPARRYQTAAELAADLRRFLDYEPILARPVSPVEKAWRWVRRHPAAAALIVATAVACLSLVAAGFSLAYSGQLRRANELAERYLYFLRLNQAGVAWRDNALDRTAALLDECPPGQRGWEWHFLDQQCHTSLLDLKGHTAGVWSVAYSPDPDGRRIASAGADGTVRVWDAATGQQLRILGGHTGTLRGVAYSPDGHRIAAGASDGTVRVWDVDTGNEIGRLPVHQEWVNGVAYSPDGRSIASASHDRTVKVWDVASGRVVLTFAQHTGPVLNVAYSPDGRRIASASSDRTVRVWDAATGREVWTLSGHTDQVPGVAFSPDGRRIASSGVDQTVRIWDAATGQEVLTLCGHTTTVSKLAFSPDGRRVASASSDRTVKVWDAATGQEVLTLRGHAGFVVSVAFSPDGRHIASACLDRTVKVWDTAIRQETLTLRGHAGPVYSVAYSPEGRRIASAGADGTVRVWDAATGQQLLELHGHEGTVFDVAYSRNRLLASAGADGTVRVWDAATGREALPPLRGHTDQLRGVAFSPDGRRIASASDDRTVKVWDTATGRVVRTLIGHTDQVVRVAYSPDGRRIASASWDNTVRIWDAATGEEVLKLPRQGADDLLGVVVYSPDGRRIAGNTLAQSVKVWDAATGQEELSLSGHTGGVWGVVFSPDGRRIASASIDKTVKVWDAATGQEVLTLHGHTRSIYNVAYSPDGRRIASASADGTVRIWDGTPVTPAWKAERLALADQRWPVWQRREAEECERQGEWFAAVWHLNQLLARHPDDADLRARRDAAQARLQAEERHTQGPELPVDVFAKPRPLAV